MHASWHLGRLQLTGDCFVEGFQDSGEMVIKLMKLVGF